MTGRLRRGAAPILGVALATSLVLAEGLAAMLPVAARPVGAGTTVIPRCPTAALAVDQTLVGSLVTAVTISGFPSQCGGARVQATVNNGTSSSSGSGTVPSGGGTVIVVLPSALAVAAAVQIDLAVTGP